jgi:hypothetical protein
MYGNGVLVVVINIGFDIHHKVNVITIMLNHSRLQLKVKKCTIKLNTTLEGKFYKSIFPLALAYVMIGHKSQGVTISSKVLVDIQNAFALGLTNVMLSRVTKRKYLTIVRQLHVDDFSPVKYTSK